MTEESEDKELEKYLKKRFLGELIASRARGYTHAAILSSSAIALAFSILLAISDKSTLSSAQLTSLKLSFVFLFTGTLLPAVSLLIIRIRKPMIDSSKSIDELLQALERAYPYRRPLLVISVTVELLGLLTLVVTGLLL